VLSEYKPSLFQQMNDKIKLGFSHWGWNQVETFLDLPTANGQVFAKWNPPLFYVPNKQIEGKRSIRGP